MVGIVGVAVSVDVLVEFIFTVLVIVVEAVLHFVKIPSSTNIIVLKLRTNQISDIAYVRKSP